MSFIIDRASVHAGDAIKMGEKAVIQRKDVDNAVSSLRKALEGLQEYSHRHTHIGRFISWLCGDKKKEATIIRLIGALEPVQNVQPKPPVPDVLRDELPGGGAGKEPEFDPEKPVVNQDYANLKKDPTDDEIRDEMDRLGGRLPKDHPWYLLWKERFGQVLLQFRQQRKPPEE